MAATLTDRFVFVHLPKTGGSFVTRMLMDVYGVPRAPIPRLSLTRLRWFLRRGNLSLRPEYGPIRLGRDPHLTSAELEPVRGGRPILGIVRNPFDWAVSAYKFGRTAPAKPKRRHRFGIDMHEAFRTQIKTFEDYLRFVWRKIDERTSRNDLGPSTISLLHFYFRDWERLASSVDAGYFSGGGYKKDMYDVRFLRTHRVNDDLADRLLEMGYRAEHVEPIRTHDRVLPRRGGRPKGERWQDAYTPELLEEARYRERFLLEWRPEFAGESTGG